VKNYEYTDILNDSVRISASLNATVPRSIV